MGELMALYGSYLALLARVQIGRQLQGKVSPSDVVQETFLRARKQFAQFRGTSEAELMAWLRRTLVSTLLRLVRHYTAQRRNVTLERQLVDELDASSQSLAASLPSPGSSPSERAVRREQAVLLADALAQLEPHYREVIILRHLEGRQFPEIAEQVGRSLHSVRHLWTRALAQLRQSLGEAV